MATQTVVWTVLPNGVHDGRLHMSVFVRPRLSDGVALSEFPDWLDWPAQDVSFAVTIGAGTPVDAASEGPARRSDLWTALLPGSTPVDSPDTQGAKALAAQVPFVRGVPISQVRNFVRTDYTTALSFFPRQPPTIRDYEYPIETKVRNGFPWPVLNLNTIRLTSDEKQAITRLIRRRFTADGYFLGGELADDSEGVTYSGAQVNFLLLEQFHRRRWDNNHTGGLGKQPLIRQLAAPADQLDFHSVIGHLGAYPEVLRLLGLVRDISIPLPASLPANPTTVQVTAAWTHTGDPAEPNEYAATACEITPVTFTTVGGTESLIANGLLRLDDPTFQLVEIDADAVGSKLLSFGESIERTDWADDPDDDVALPPPSMESTGLALHRVDKAKALYDALVKAVGQQKRLQSKALATTPLYAEELTRGFRLDVWDDDTQDWHSLCLRSGSYTFDATTITIDDEGFIESAHTEQDNDDTIYVHESMARWVGYSLVAPRPGLGTGGDDDSELVGSDTEPDPRFNLKTSFTAARGTLPKLRFGRKYRLRARVVDLAGNSLSLDDFDSDDFAGATPEVTYHRFEPVGAPNLLLRTPRTEGESPERLVIRSNYNTSASADAQRHVAPNKTAELIAEQHGIFDVPATILNPGGVSRAAYGVIAAKDPGTLDDLGESDPGGGDVRYYDTNHLKLPYLPDVLARGAAFSGMPGSGADDVVTVDFDFALLQSWPNARPFRLRLIEGSGAPQWDSFSRVLTVKMPKGRVQEVRYSCRVDSDDVELLGVWSWLKEYVASGGELPFGVTLDSIKEWAVKGQTWLLTPYRTLSLVHAIRQPLTPPAFSKPIAVRQIGETFAKIIDKVTVDRRSSSKIELIGTWQEPIDLLTQPAPQTLDASDRAFELAVDSREKASDIIAINKTHEFRDTKYRKVNYSLVATTRFAEYFIERKVITLTAGTATPVSAAGIVPGSDVITSNGTPTKQTYVRDRDYVLDYAAGTVTANDPLNGTSVEVAFVAPPITRASTEAKPAAVVDVPSSARPVAPDVAYVVPTFGWETATSGGTITSKRLGHGLRIFLRRPWYSSGDGEQLGVVLLPEQPPTDPDARQKMLDKFDRYVTTWGLDPAFATQPPPATSPLPAVPLVPDFPLAVRPKTRLKLAESDNNPTLTEHVAVAPHDVGYDEERQLWYADITVTPTAAYTPFIRLALARYQPISITNVELSTIVLAQFAQLSPDRTLTIVSTGSTELTVTVAGGLTYVPISGYARPAQVEALVQTANPALSGDLAWTTVGPPTLLPTGAEPATWSGTVTLPGPQGSEPFRLVVKEFEVPSQGDERRLIYADAVQL